MCDHNCNQGRSCTCGKSYGLLRALAWVGLFWVVAIGSAALIVWG